MVRNKMSTYTGMNHIENAARHEQQGSFFVFLSGNRKEKEDAENMRNTIELNSMRVLPEAIKITVFDLFV